MARTPPMKDPMGTFVRIYTEVLDSPSWLALSSVSVRLYLVLRRKLFASGHNNGNISAALTTVRSSGITSSASLAKALRELQAVGLIATTRKSVGVERGSKVCCLYRFTDQDCHAVPKLAIEAVSATHDWRKFKTIDQARAAIHAAEQAATRKAGDASAKKKRTVRNLNCIDSKSELMTLSDSSKSEHRPKPSVRNLNRQQHPPKQPEIPMDKGFQAIERGEIGIVLTTSNFEHLLTVAIPTVESAAP
jgi:hypothetical protein